MGGEQLHLIYVANQSVKLGLSSLSEAARPWMSRAWQLLVVTWFVYGFCYLVPGIPGINQSADWVVVRQLGYTLSDFLSKAVFGLLLAQVAIIQSRSETKQSA